MEILSDKLTPLSPENAAIALSDGYRLVTGFRPSKKILGRLLGQTALETGNWKSIHNYNFGNVKAAAGDAYAQYFRCSEVLDGVEEFFDPPDLHCKFAAYQTAVEGAAAYVRTLKHRPAWWKGLHAFTDAGFAEGLAKQPGAYFTASPKLYAKILADRKKRYIALAGKYAGLGAGSMILLGLVGYGSYKYFSRRAA